VLIDGRSVYTPLFSGVYWDMQAVPPEDIERIEVISGPGATLWGANAVNGVSTSSPRKSGDTQGGFVEIGGGNQQANALIQYGGRVGSDLTYRVYAQDPGTPTPRPRPAPAPATTGTSPRAACASTGRPPAPTTC